MSLRKGAELLIENFEKATEKIDTLSTQLDDGFVKLISEDGKSVVCGPSKILYRTSEAFDDLDNELKCCRSQEQTYQYLKVLMEKERGKAISTVQTLFRTLGMELLPPNV